MESRDFLDAAKRSVTYAGEADCRSAISRAYYAIYHVARAFEGPGLQIPPNRAGHKELVQRLKDARGGLVGNYFSTLFDRRVEADYELGEAVSQATATDSIKMAEWLFGNYP